VLWIGEVKGVERAELGLEPLDDDGMSSVCVPPGEIGITCAGPYPPLGESVRSLS
jgi:hypothetical protein